jgi:hypothetical protein
MSRSAVRAATLAVVAALVARSPDARAEDPRQQCVSDAESGQALLRSGKPREASRLLFACAQPICPGLVRRDCTTYLADAQAAVPSIVLGARDAEGRDVTDARVLLDGVLLEGALRGQMTEVESGPHRLRFERAGAAPVEQSFVAREREKGRSIVIQFGGAVAPLPLAAPTADARRPAPPLAIVLGSVGLAAAGVAIGFGVRGISERSSGCDANHVCNSSSYGTIQTSFDVADVGAVVAVLALAGATWSYVTRPAVGAPRVSVDAGPRSASLRLGLAF